MNKDCDKSYFKKPEFYRLTGGNNYVRIDAEDKVTGHGKYADRPHGAFPLCLCTHQEH